MKTTILYDNTSISPKLKADFGFSCLIVGGLHGSEEYNVMNKAELIS